MSANEQKIEHWIYSAELTRQNNYDSQFAVYYHPSSQNTNNHFWPLKQEEIRKLTFVIWFPSFFLQTGRSLRVCFKSSSWIFFIFRCKVCSAAGGHIKKLEILSRLHFERAKSAERYDETRKQSDAILKIQHSGGTGPSSCLVHKVMNYQIDKKQNKQPNKQTGLSATCYSPISSSTTL